MPERTPAPSFVRVVQSVAEVGAAVSRADREHPAETAEGEPGRPEEEPSRRMVCWCADQWRSTGNPPSLSRIYEQSKGWYAKLGGYGRPKAKRCIERARALMDGGR